MNFAYLFNLTSLICFLRSEKTSPDLTKSLLENISISFEQDAGDGIYLYNIYKNDEDLIKISGFTNSRWEELESLIIGNKKIKVAISSLVFALCVYKKINIEFKEYFFNNLYKNIYNGSPPSYFSYIEIDNLVSSFNILDVISEIRNSNSDIEVDSPLSYYSFYDSSSLFADLESDPILKQTIKDSENQYYYLSGSLLYDLNINSSECFKNNISISTPTGEKRTTVYRNLPCFEKDSLIGPVSGITFLRFFNDGPPSSGYFDQNTFNSYRDFDEKTSYLNLYFSNKTILYSFTKDQSGNYIILKSGVQVDAPGPFSSSAEYGFSRTNLITADEGCEWTTEELESLPLMRMHQGDNLPKYHFYKTKVGEDCITGYSVHSNWTGFKFANFKLNDSWINYFKFIQINPRINETSVLKRALNIENYFENGVVRSPYLNVTSIGDKTLSCDNYVGPPQLVSDYSTLPGFAFYQTFDNKTFGTGSSGEFASINIFPALSSGSATTNSRSNRSLTVSSFPIFTGKNTFHDPFGIQTKILINKTFNSNSIANYDDVFKKTIGIGDAFNNEISGDSSIEYNAGYLYTGYNIYKNGQKVNLGSLLSEYEMKKVGGKYSQVRYLTGYLDKQTNKTYSINALTAHISTDSSVKFLNKPGEYMVYYYFNTDTGENSILSVNTGWTGSFAPIPEGVVQNPNRYSGLYAYQKVENYFPRYSSGPFASYENKFIYPNAQYAYEKYNSFVNGFPNKISYVINVREETVRELYLTSGFDGEIDYQKVIRVNLNNPSTLDSQSSSQDLYSVTGIESKIIVPFVLSTSDPKIKKKYDYSSNTGFYSFPGGFFNKCALNENLVNSFYVTNEDYWLQNNINSVVYKEYEDSRFLPYIPPYSPFINGIKITGKLNTKKIKIKKDSQIIDSVVSYSEPRSEGLHWGYKGSRLSGEMLYAPPIFDLSTFTKNVSGTLFDIFTKNGNGINWNLIETFSNNGFVTGENLSSNSTYSTFTGKDPIFYEYIGGRIGQNAKEDGGHHSKGIIGDAWYDFSGNLFGNGEFDSTYYRVPENDLHLFLLSNESGSLNIYTRGLAFYPFYHNLKYKPFLSSSLNYDIGVNLAPVNINNSEYYYTFNLLTHFPLKNVSSEGEFYFESGFEIGPFNQDVEFCVVSGNYIYPSGNLIIDGETIAGKGPFQKTYDDIYNNHLNQFVITGFIAPGSGNRSPRLTTFKLIPSGKSVSINISGNTKIGFDKNAIVTIRPRTNLVGIVSSQEDYNNLVYLSGDSSFLDPYHYINNETEQKFSFLHDGDIRNLIGKKFEYITIPKIDVLYPKPNDQADFTGTLKAANFIDFDSLGNIIYKGKKGPTHDYWKIKNPNLKLTGIRNVSRLLFEIESINLEYGDIPYQSHKVIIPSGNCTVSGVFAYTGQAESAILSQGLLLSGLSNLASLESYDYPRYASDVLRRLPEELETPPSGGILRSVFEAPSYVKKRKDKFVVNENSIYEDYTPKGFNYNKFIWASVSDFAELNPELTYEDFLREDDNLFTGSRLFYSASTGQFMFSGFSEESGFYPKYNTNENLIYKTAYLYAFIDSISTNASYNIDKCIFKVSGKKDSLTREDLSGFLGPEYFTYGLSKFFNL